MSKSRQGIVSAFDNGLQLHTLETMIQCISIGLDIVQCGVLLVIVCDNRGCIWDLVSQVLHEFGYCCIS